MPAIRNLRIRNAHSASTGRPLLSCAFQGCGRQFKTKSSLKKHQRTSHRDSPDSAPGPSNSRSSPSPDSSAHRFPCTVLGCLRSFKSKAAVTRHSRAEHAQNPSRRPPLTAPSSPTNSEPPVGSRSSSCLPLFFPDDRSQSPHNNLADDQADVGYEPNPDFSYYDNDNFVPSGSDGLHHNAMHSPSNHSSCDNSQPAHGTPPPVHLNQASDHNGTSGRVKRLYHPLINGRFF